MLRIILVLTVSAFALGHPSYFHTPEVVQYGYEVEPTVIGHTLHSIPTAVSHQSQTIVHEKRPYLRPIVEHIPVPVVKTYAVPSEIVSSPYYNGWDNGYEGLRTASYGDGWNQW